MVVGVITCVLLIVIVIAGLFWCRSIKNEEIKTNKKRQSTYDKWYDLGVMLSDIVHEKNNKDKGE